MLQFIMIFQATVNQQNEGIGNLMALVVLALGVVALLLVALRIKKK